MARSGYAASGPRSPDTLVPHFCRRARQLRWSSRACRRADRKRRERRAARSVRHGTVRMWCSAAAPGVRNLSVWFRGFRVRRTCRSRENSRHLSCPISQESANLPPDLLAERLRKVSRCRDAERAAILGRGRGCHERPERLGTTRISSARHCSCRRSPSGWRSCRPRRGGPRRPAGSGPPSTPRARCPKSPATSARRSPRKPPFASKPRLRPTTNMSCSSTGQKVGTGNSFRTLDEYNITEHIKTGRNTIAVKVTNRHGSTAALAARMFLRERSGGWVTYSSDETWRTSLNPLAFWNGPLYNDRTWEPAQNFGKLGETAPWDHDEEVAGEHPAAFRTFSHLQGIRSSARDRRRHDRLADRHGLQRVRAHHFVPGR